MAYLLKIEGRVNAISPDITGYLKSYDPDTGRYSVTVEPAS